MTDAPAFAGQTREELLGDPKFMTEADLAYIRANYTTLDELCSGRPETPQDVRALIDRELVPDAAYRLPDGSEWFPHEYFALIDAAGGPESLHAYFAARCPEIDLEDIWRGYLTGIYAVCLRSVTPETILRKGELVDRIAELLDNPATEDANWRDELRSSVDALDELERPFSPDFDRIAFGRPPTRDMYIVEPRRRFADIFAGS